MRPIPRLIVALVVVVVMTLTADAASAATSGGNNEEIDLTAFSFGYHGNPIGAVNPSVMIINFRNVSTEDFHEFVVAKLAPSHARDGLAKLIAEMDRAFRTGDFSFLDPTVGGGGPFPPGVVGGAFAPPGGSFNGFANLSKTGTYFYLCAVQEPDGTPHYHLGMIGKFQVTAH